jgi:subtilisin-like proprotein convertase family protein
MTIWTIQEYAVDTDQWGVQVAQLRAPAPAEPISVTPNEIPQGKSSVKLTIHGKSHDGSGFFDPGKDFDCHLKVKISDDVKVEKVKYVDPTTIKVKVSTKHTSLGTKKIKIINPDGQKVREHGLLTVVA